MNTYIRPAKASDAAAINSLLSQIVLIHYASRPDIFRSSYTNNQAEFNSDEEAPVFVSVDENGVVVGCLWCIINQERDNSLKRDRDWLIIDDICVDEKYRRHGLGKKLVDFAVSFARQNGLPRIELNVYNDNLNAVNFYEKYGFKTQKRVMEFDIPVATTFNNETDKENRVKLYPIILSEYNTAWPEWYAEEKIYLKRLIGTENIARISHFGSTSVPGLMAKPTVDILLEIKDDANVRKLMDALSSPEYICLNPPDMPTSPPHLMFLKGYLPDGFAEKVYHIHVRYFGDWDELYFRDYLITHPETASRYAVLKSKLQMDFEYDRDGYTKAKTTFIRAVTEKAREELT